MTVTIKYGTSKKCFLSAPVGTDLAVLRKNLKVRGVDVLAPQDFTIGGDWADETQAQIARADLVIGVLSGNESSQWVLFELGLAAALGRRILLITPPGVESIPFAPRHMLVLRVSPDNEEAIGFALDQILSAPNRKIDGKSTRSKASPGLGQKADDLLNALDRALAASDGAGVEAVVSAALNASGTDVVVPSQTRDKGADFAVWSDSLETLVGNPLLVEVKSKIRRKEDAVRITREMSAYLSATSAQWGLLLFGDGPGPQSEWWDQSSPNILVLPLRAFLNDLRSRTFPEVVRDLRNSRVHGSNI
ncbi:TIR domain-containing protein [Paraburkholderia fungorum]|uniref:TIR domain-containing protein n=1 Tax=Paraburkholderia fungorum TaxID=134537 RepID=UPI001C1EA510|nr:TIR domain-containing protein [Paraburkholderia fungorum]MBU7440912.1 nucleoside 2-deoxyribosyltransferase [Paraburkholderia fungorum]